MRKSLAPPRYHHNCKILKHFQFLYREIVSNVFGLGSVAYWMEATMFCSLRKKVFFPRKWRHNDVAGGRNISQNV